MDKKLFNALQIKYIKLFFTVEFTSSAKIPEHKESALRGGMGEMLLRANCIQNRDCKNCNYVEECIVHRTMYSHYQIRPPFVQSGDSIGYVIYCDDHRKFVGKGDTLEFQLMLFGNAIVHFNQFVQAFYSLGIQGLGNNDATFDIVSIKNQWQQPIMMNQIVHMDYYIPESIYDYVIRRYHMIEESTLKLKFSMPLTLKYKNEFLKEFDIDPILKAIKRRIYMMNCYVGKDVEDWYKELNGDLPILYDQKVYNKGITRYSSTQNTKMTLKGIQGVLNLSNVSDTNLFLLLAGELIHIGKNTSFGFGKYIVHEK